MSDPISDEELAQYRNDLGHDNQAWYWDAVNVAGLIARLDAAEADLLAARREAEGLREERDALDAACDRLAVEVVHRTRLAATASAVVEAAREVLDAAEGIAHAEVELSSTEILAEIRKILAPQGARP